MGEIVGRYSLKILSIRVVQRCVIPDKRLTVAGKRENQPQTLSVASSLLPA